VTADEKDEMIEEIMANCNATIAVTAALMQSEAGTIVEYKISDKGFV
jgi:hypothetical protein